jgi:hypothetical protein
MKQTKKINYITNPALQGKKYEFTPESKEYMDKGKLFLLEKAGQLLINS